MTANSVSTNTASANSAPVSGAAGRYASALFDLARDSHAIEAVEGELSTLQSAIAASDDLRAFLKSPVYGRDEQLAAIGALASKAGFGALVSNFLKLIAQNRRLSALEEMIRAFRALSASHRGEVTAEAATAAAMSDDQIKALRLEIERMVGKAVNLETRVDPDLLGGLVVKIGSKMVDASLKTKLNRLKTVMKKA
ncbi:F0F1 ATP synthase subunit delta [Hyphococcus sp.]|uniref:F0F1 ATP synthase subunit delta n=1 Tax=Hyphococcus sp. TaxID=2038636 RepID=UPI00208BD145|nr:MAG: ATP synthase subunit delta [Marinicaulis sp.]